MFVPVANLLCHFFPVSGFVVEGIKAPTKGKRGWDRIFSPLEVGKAWFYAELGKLAPVQAKQGFETKAQTVTMEGAAPPEPLKRMGLLRASFYDYY